MSAFLVPVFLLLVNGSSSSSTLSSTSLVIIGTTLSASTVWDIALVVGAWRAHFFHFGFFMFSLTPIVLSNADLPTGISQMVLSARVGVRMVVAEIIPFVVVVMYKVELDPVGFAVSACGSWVNSTNSLVNWATFSMVVCS